MSWHPPEWEKSEKTHVRQLLRGRSFQYIILFNLESFRCEMYSFYILQILQMRKLRNEPYTFSFFSPCHAFSLPTSLSHSDHTANSDTRRQSYRPHSHYWLVSFYPSGRAEPERLAQEQSLGWHRPPWCRLPAVTVQCVTYPVTRGSTGWSRWGGSICKSHTFAFNLDNTFPK